MLTLNLFNLINSIALLYSNTNILPYKAIEMLNISFVSTMLTSLIVMSLVLTFYAGGTTVHKVLGLLLVSVFVVFLWVLQTQFLFIYIVYIMAFISAVLMLFLSVVLMLPISTLTSKNYSTDSKHNRNFTPFMLISSNLIPYDITCTNYFLFSLFLLITTIIFISSYSKTYSIFMFSSNRDFLKTTLGLNNEEILLSQINSFLKSNTLNQTSVVAVMEIEEFYVNFILRNNMVFHILFWYILFIYVITNSLFITLIKQPYAYFKLQLISYNVTAKHFMETFIQTSLYSSVVASVFALVTVKQSWFTNNANSLSIDASLGLSQIKELLYGDYSYFLIYSTVVLLVALLGAAVMTRNKR